MPKHAPAFAGSESRWTFEATVRASIAELGKSTVRASIAELGKGKVAVIAMSPPISTEFVEIQSVLVPV